MQKKLLAAMVSSLVAGQAMAITVFDDGTNKLDIDGHIGARYVHNEGADNVTEGDSSRINFGFESKLNEDVTGFAMAEWGFDVTNTDSNTTFSNRLGYVGVEHNTFGALSFGKQWSSYSKVAGWTDMFATTGGQASGMYHSKDGILGTGRADDAVQYNGSFAGLNVSAQMQLGDKKYIDDLSGLDNGERNKSYGLALSYELPMGLAAGFAYNEATIKRTPLTAAADTSAKKAKSMIVGIKYDANNIYAALTYSDLKNVAEESSTGMQEMKEGKGYELYTSYQLNENFKVETGYNQLKNKDAGATDELKYIPLGVVYTTGPIQVSATYQFEKSNIRGEEKKDKAIFQARYYF